MWLAVAVLLIGVSAANADYLFMQYIMGFRKNGTNPPTPIVPGGPPIQPGGPPSPGSANANDSEIIQIPVYGVVEGTFKVLPTATGRVKATYKQKLGITNLYNDDALVTQPAKFPTVKARYAAKHESLGKGRTHEKEYELAEWCLTVGLVNECASLLEEVASSGKKTDLDKLDRAVEAYTQVKSALAKPVEREDNANHWRAKLGFRVSSSDHYSMLYNAALNDPPEVKERLKALEENMRAVYIWFALKGVVLQMPDQKLVTVLLDQPSQFTLQRQLIEDEPSSPTGSSRRGTTSPSSRRSGSTPRRSCSASRCRASTSRAGTVRCS